MSSADDELSQRWSFTAPSATLPGRRHPVPSTATTSLRSSLVTSSCLSRTAGGGAPQGLAVAGSTRRGTGARPSSREASDEGVAETFRRLAEERTRVLAEERASSEAAAAPVASTVVPLPDPYAPPPADTPWEAPRLPTRIVRRRPSGHAAPPSRSTPGALDRARQAKVGGVSVLVALVLVLKVVGMILAR